MRKNVIGILVCFALATVSFVTAGAHLNDPGFALIILGTIFTLGVVSQAIEYHNKQNARNLILHALDSQTGYLVIGRLPIDTMNLVYLKDLTDFNWRIAEIRGSYPPEGFMEEMVDGRIFLIPHTKKLAIGHKSEFVFAPEISNPCP